MKRLNGRRALTTGAARGIGLEFARVFLAEGAIAVRLDVTDQTSIDASVAEVERAFGGIDIRVRIAALFTAAPIVEITRAHYDRVFAVSVSDPLFMMQAVARGMTDRGKGGKISNMASQAGRRGIFHRAHMAWHLDRLFDKGEGHDWALIGAGVRPGPGAMVATERGLSEFHGRLRHARHLGPQPCPGPGSFRHQRRRPGRVGTVPPMGGEDNFPQGRPPLEKIGAKFVADVGRHELMKLRILNGGHAAIAYPSTLLGHHLVHDAMADPQIATSLRALETREIISALADALRDDNAIEGLAQEVAFWSRCCKATDEAGNAITPDDGNSDALRKCALAARRDTLTFLANDTVFGTLAAKPRFHEAFPAS